MTFLWIHGSPAEQIFAKTIDSNESYVLRCSCHILKCHLDGRELLENLLSLFLECFWGIRDPEGKFVEPEISKWGLWRLQLDAIGICQNPLLGSRFLLQLVVLGYHQHGAMSGSQEVHFYFKLHINADICTLPDFFWTTTLPAHQSVRWLTFLITPVVSILSVAELEFSVQYWGHRALYHCDSWQNV